ncbi:MAG TPA: EF-hand domain-containing protein [Pirellulales bacterium]|nr:EF-hand domain-containing protein [Pirellulales bacterium]
MVSATWILVLSVLAADRPAPAAALAKTKTDARSSAAARSPQAARPADRRDVMLLLDGGPLHLRLNLALGGVSLAEARRQYIERLIASLDANRDGKLSRDEAARSPLLRTKQRAGAAQFLEGLGGRSLLARRDVERAVDRLGGEAVVYRQDLSSSQNDLEVFKLLDADSSGLLDQKELDASSDLVLSKDEDGDECVSFQEFFPPPPPPDPMQVLLGTAQRPPTPLATVADIVRDAGEPLLPRRLLARYDRNRDLQLDAKELNWSNERLAALDADGDKRLDADELRGLGHAEPDVELSADLKPAEAGGGTLAVEGAGGERLDAAERADYAKIAFAGAVLTFSHRNLDPIASAIETAMRQFNLLDGDANGYLDRDETAERIRFERGLFELIDADGDDKLFADEMKQYVAARSEPAATTCRVNVYDTGYGFFMALDANADGRVSVRELRQAPAALARLDRDRRPGLGQKEPVRHFHMEFVRGSYQLFGPSEQLAAQTPAFQQRRPIGPIWFQRMDRNNDGDLTWNEFLGPREVFHDLDGDADGLVDPREAGKVK